MATKLAFFSIQAMTLAAAINAVWLELPEDLKTQLPDWLLTGMTIFLMFLGLAGRLVLQIEKDE